ncbi:MAG TPA: SPOR domain-containing protein [Pseudothermotoga sp.]|nr:SPOR domain-containing protein [Pseudothermotoga sp.]HOK83406.1 SPOR domain-containing protein [Pseudothermotoga sp.]HPP69479.1 SPOR domain-containing protein [Pseudothermotoga sp.]
MPKGQIRLTDTQARILAILIIVLSIGFVSFTLATFFILKSRSNVQVEIVEVPPPKIEVPVKNSTPTESVTEYVNPSIYRLEEFDYKKLITQATEVVERGANLSVYVIQSEDVLKIVRGSNLPFVICQYSKDTYTVAVVGDYSFQNLTPMRTLYGVLVLSVINKETALERVLSFRSAGYPAYLMHFVRDGRDWYSLVIGAFSDVNSAEDFNKNLNWTEVMKIAGTQRPGYVGRIAP